jgi:hypothetical protein
VGSLERLAGAAPEDREASHPAALRGRRYREDRVHLLVRDPRRALAVWEISPALAALAASRAASANVARRYQLRLERRSAGEPARTLPAVDLPDAEGGEAWYVDLTGPGDEARVRLGLHLPSGFDPLLTSRWVSVPPEGPCAEAAPWDLDPEDGAWLQLQAGRARPRGVAPAPSSVSRYLVPSERLKP